MTRPDGKLIAEAQPVAPAVATEEKNFQVNLSVSISVHQWLKRKENTLGIKNWAKWGFLLRSGWNRKGFVVPNCGTRDKHAALRLPRTERECGCGFRIYFEPGAMGVTTNAWSFTWQLQPFL